ncbi:hypothetical protein [Streptomyces sp. NPDC058579]|uniref:hypothetical protein n=1 Tax=Streptomyces sp. NPDC058579 TaxID=3346548 RepID=UPI0036650842
MTMRDQAEAVLTARLDELGIAWTSERHAPVFTAALRACGHEPEVRALGARSN